MSILTQHKEMARLCVGCGACLGLCSVGAIKLKATKDVLTVSFNYSRCTKCGMCTKLCPALSNFYAENLTNADALGRIEKVFFGYSPDHRVRYPGTRASQVDSRKLVKTHTCYKSKSFKSYSYILIYFSWGSA